MQLLAEVHLDRPVDDRDQEPEARIADHLLVRPAEAEHDHPLVLLHDPHGQVQDHEHHDEDEAQGDEGGDEFHVVLQCSGLVGGPDRRYGLG